MILRHLSGQWSGVPVLFTLCDRHVPWNLAQKPQREIFYECYMIFQIVFRGSKDVISLFCKGLIC